jgi:hypothetical protein
MSERPGPDDESLEAGLERLRRKERYVRPCPDDSTRSTHTSPGVHPFGAFNPALGSRGYRKKDVDRLLLRIGEMSAFDIRATDLHTAPERAGYESREVERFVEQAARDAAVRDAVSRKTEALPAQEQLSIPHSAGLYVALVCLAALLATGWFVVTSGTADLWIYALLGLLVLGLGLQVTQAWRGRRDVATCMPDGLHLQHSGHDTIVPWNQVDYARLEEAPVGESTVNRLCLHLANGSSISPDVFNDRARKAIVGDCATIGRWRDHFHGADDAGTASGT